MIIEREVLVSVLLLTKNGPATLEDISKNTGTVDQVAHDVLRRYAENGYFQFEGDSVVAGKKNRLQMAVRSFELGADLERVCDLLSWDEFEDISAEAIAASSFRVLKHFRFKSSSRRWEVDLLGMKKPLVLSVDCKHWHKGWRRSSIMKVVKSQVERTQALMEASDLLRGKMGKTPIVPVLHIRNFLTEVFPYLVSLRSFSREYGPSIDEY